MSKSSLWNFVLFSSTSWSYSLAVSFKHFEAVLCIFSETHQELQTLQNNFLNLQTHFVNIDYENSELENYNKILEEDENEKDNEFLFISEYQLQKYH
ncbi:9861_t:CDS:2 [Dentiscutata heterogama]|uniref:9861_t:CDS:1 n=1 Tax=Dentiscutata heterogama TaxID=1316150 RepID=A0ACA9KWA6_9GLOM|nr:9861_t:CDS:2 [Dentiscutata heterogama]